MKQTLIACLVVFLGLFAMSGVMAQETAPAEKVPPAAAEPDRSIVSDTMQRAEEMGQQAQEQVDKAVASVEESEEAKALSAGLLHWIYSLAEAMSFAAFHWVAFAIMVAGVIGFALQLVLGKLVVLARTGFSLSEIISDGIGLIISLIGLLLTTQAAAENSDFTQSAFAVLSAAAAGLVLGILLYIWGQAQELQAVRGRKSD